MFNSSENYSVKNKKLPAKKRTPLFKSSSDKFFTGICGGLGENLGVDSDIIRFLFILLSFASGAGVILYLVLFFLMPSQEEDSLDDKNDVMDTGEIYETMAARQASFNQLNTESGLFQESNANNQNQHKFQLEVNDSMISNQDEAPRGEVKAVVIEEKVFSKKNIFALSIVFLGMIFIVNEIIPWYWISPLARIPLLTILIGLAFVIRSNKN